MLRTTILLLLALAVVGCGGDGETDKPIEPPPFDNTGGTDQGTDPCDLDGDGFAAAHCGGLDCNDLAPDVHPDAAEICDGVEDENCDGSVDEGCDCSPSDARACFPGQEGRNVGLCRDGVQHCSADGTWGPCEGAVVPQPEGDLCDGLDQDCNGTADDGLTNACGLCGETPAELCGNGLDDDCNGIIDDPAVCSVDCSSADPESPGALACCVRAFDGQASATTPSRHAFACDEWEGLEACETRACEDLDPDDDVLCESRCTEEGCVCGKIVDEEILPHEGCGFATPCTLQGCAERKGQSCYSGPPHTLGVGECRGGLGSCTDGEWGSCEGEVLPVPEICGNGLDDDCDGLIDEEDGLTGARCVVTRCEPDAFEICNNGLDDDCDGLVDEGCVPNASEQSCWPGPLGAAGRGICEAGVQRAIDGRWGPCEGAVLPEPERCGDGIDSDCNGLGAWGTEDELCCVPDHEVCNGIDDDCDGVVDEGLRNACGECGGPCGLLTAEDPADCSPSRGRLCENIRVDPRDEAAFTLGGSETLHNDSIYVAYFDSNTGNRYVSRLSSEDASVMWTIPTAANFVGARPDGGVWLRFSNSLWRYGPDGALVCSVDVPENMHSLAVGRDGSVWISSLFFDGAMRYFRLFRVDGEGVESGTSGPSTCTLADLAPSGPELYWPGAPGAQTPLMAQIAADGVGNIWVSAGYRLDTLRMTADQFSPPGNVLFVTAPDGGAFAIAGTAVTSYPGRGPLVPEEGTLDLGEFLNAHDAVARGNGELFVGIRGIEPKLFHYDLAANSTELVNFDGAAGGIGGSFTIDRAGRLWTIRGSTALLRYDVEADSWHEFSVPQATQLMGIGTALSGSSRSGRWVHRFDAGAVGTSFSRLDWEMFLPPSANLEVWVRMGNRESELESSRCGPFRLPPVDLTTCPGASSSRFVEVDFSLASPAGLDPSIRNVNVEWSRP